MLHHDENTNCYSNYCHTHVNATDNITVMAKSVAQSTKDLRRTTEKVKPKQRGT